jgi:hypothetical protein
MKPCPEIKSGIAFAVGDVVKIGIISHMVGMRGAVLEEVLGCMEAVYRKRE